MYAYYIMFGILIFLIIFTLFSWLIVQSNFQSRLIWLSVMFGGLVIVRCLPDWKTWNDLPYYADAFFKLSEGSWDLFTKKGWNVEDIKSEPLWMIYNWVIAHIVPYFPFLLLVTAFLNLKGYFMAIKYWISGNLWVLSVLIIIVQSYSQSFFVLRQHLAIGLVVWSYVYMLEKKYLVMSILLCLAMGFHQTAVITLPAFFIHLFVKDTKKIFLCLGVYAILMSIAIKIMDTIVDSYFVGYNSYAVLEDDDVAVNSKVLLLSSFLLIWRWFVMKKACWYEGLNRFLTVLMILGVINSFIGTGTTTYMSRLNMYYSLLTFLYIPNTLSCVLSRRMRLIYGGIYLLFLAYFALRNAYEQPDNLNLFII